MKDFVLNEVNRLLKYLIKVNDNEYEAISDNFTQLSKIDNLNYDNWLNILDLVHTNDIEFSRMLLLDGIKIHKVVKTQNLHTIKFIVFGDCNDGSICFEKIMYIDQFISRKNNLELYSL